MAVVAALQNNPPFPIYAVPYTVVFPMLDADGDPVTGETCDSERSLDGDTGADCTNEGTEITFTTATNKGMYYLTLTAAEMTSVITIVTVYASNSKATPIVLYPKALPPLADTTATAGAAGTITLAVGSSALDDYYAGCYIYLNGGTGSGQGRMITSYVGSTRVATIAPNWGTNPDDTSEYIIYQTAYALLNDGNLNAPVATVDTVVDGIQTDLSNATDGLGALKALIDTLDSVADGIKSVTDNLPDSGALSTINGYVDILDHATNGLANIKSLIDALQTTATAIDDLSKAAGDGDLASIKGTVEGIPTTAMRGTDNVVLAGPTKAEMDTAHALLATPAQVASALTTYDAPTKGEMDAALLIIKQAAAGTFNRETDSLQAIRDRGDAAWTTGAGNGGDATAANQLLLIKILTNKWEVTGNQFIIYDDDGTTPLYTYDLTQDGTATEFNPDLRTPV